MAKRLVLSLVILLVLITPISFAETNLKGSQQKYDALNKEMEKIRANLEASNKKEKQILSNLNELDKSLDNLEREKLQINNSIEKLNKELKVLENELKAKQNELNESEKKLDALRKEAQEGLRHMQKINARGWWSFVFDSNSISEFWIRSHQMKQFLAADLTAVEKTTTLYEEHQKKANELETKKQELNKKKNDLESSKKKLENNEKEIKKTLDEKKKALNNVEKEKSLYDKALREMERASEELGEAIRKLQQKTREDDGVKQALKMIWPVQGRISSDYGWRLHPILNENRFHTGLDIAAPSGRDIKVAADGTVILAGWVQGYGLTVVVSHGNETTTLYGHTSKLLCQAGERVKQGQVIAKVGSTGVSSGPHLHFEIRVNGDPVNPWGWLPVAN